MARCQKCGKLLLHEEDSGFCLKCRIIDLKAALEKEQGNFRHATSMYKAEKEAHDDTQRKLEEAVKDAEKALFLEEKCKNHEYELNRLHELLEQSRLEMERLNQRQQTMKGICPQKLLI